MSKILSTDMIRKKWIEFFKSKDHFELPFSSLIPIDDPSLLWVNSGVATLKPYFEGKKNPPSYRMVNCQKAIRTNDIENVGRTTRHHTLFEMLGNFSIGDYFKKEAIHMSWEFLTSPKWLNIDKNQLYVTVYEKDILAYNIWLNEIKIPSEKIIKGNKKQNFWEIGEGPSGPNTEIFFDRGEKYDFSKQGLKLLKDDIENDRYIEIWNIVFSEFNSNGNGKYTPLPRKNIDTGAGLERFATILQDVPTSFDIDIFQKIIKEIEKLANKKYKYDAKDFFNKNNTQTKINSSYKIIADHIRAVTFTIADGVYPSNKNQGYVIRKLIRRAMMHGRKLEIKGTFLFKLVDVVISAMGNYYNYLQNEKIKIKNILKDEEDKYINTLIEGEKQLLLFIKKYNTLTVKQAFMLFESFGYPLELISEICSDNNIILDKSKFIEYLENHKRLAKQNQKSVTAISKQNDFLLNLNLKSEFVGYEKWETNNSEIIYIFKDDKEITDSKEDKCFIILDKTPFYAEKGGQVADKGIIKNENFICEVLDVQTGVNNEHIHYVDIIDGKLEKKAKVTASIDKEKRLQIMKNHSGTHILHSAIREVLGINAMQVGSYNNSDYLRIDITYNKMISNDEIQKINDLCNKKIQEKIKSEVIYCTYEKAINDLKALAFFKDKYDTSKNIRVVKFGDFSIELCGGTHVENSTEIESLLVIKYNSIGNNTYRFTALTSNITVNQFLNDTKKVFIEKLKKVNDLNIELGYKIISLEEELTKNIFQNYIYLLNSTNELKDKIIDLNNQINNKKMNLEFNEFNKLSPHDFKDDLKIITTSFNDISNRTIKRLIDFYRDKHNINTVILFNNIINDDKGVLFLSISEDLKKTYHCGSIIKKINNKINGKGGGNNIYSQTGYNKNIDEINNFIKEDIKDFF